MAINSDISAPAKIGVFLCRCGGKIEGRVDLDALEETLKGSEFVHHVEILPFTCMTPGLKAVRKTVADQGLNRLIIAGCESRVMLKKFEGELEDLDIFQGQIEMVNLRDHVAQSNNGEPGELAAKGARLIVAAARALSVLAPSPKVAVTFEGPVMILGGGIATYPAAQELVRRNIDTIIAVNTDDPEDEIRMMHEQYPGDRHYHDRLRAIMKEVFDSPHIKKISVGELEKVMGRMGDYQVTFSGEKGRPPLVFNCSAIIAALDGQMRNQGSDFGHDGVRVVCHTEMEEHFWLHGAPEGQVVFWINDLETPGRPYAYLSARSAWHMACFIKENRKSAQVKVMYNDQLKLPLSSEERALARRLDIEWIPYDSRIRPTVQSGFITYNGPDDNIERELPWDKLCLSPLRTPGHESLKIAKILGFDVTEGQFLERNPQMVRPEQVGQDEKFLAGSSRNPCDLRDTIRQGRRAATRVAEMVELSAKGELYAPRMVCTVDPDKCIGCGLCNEICDCGGIEPFEGTGGHIPRKVDPMVCTGGGTCAAACPYNALTLQNNTTQMREVRVAALAKALQAGDVLGFGCNWGGGAAADHAGLKGLRHDARFHLLTIGCIGQLDPVILGRAFLDGADSMLLVGCPPEECHHSYGLDHTWSRILLIKKLLTLSGLDRNRIALAHADMNDPEGYVRTVNSFMAKMDGLAPIERNDETMERIQAMYDTLNVPRVRWMLGAGLRRPHESHYPADQRNALAYDETLTDVVTEELVRVRVVNLLRRAGQTMPLKEISQALKEKETPVMNCLKELTGEGAVSRIYKDRTPYYSI